MPDRILRLMIVIIMALVSVLPLEMKACDLITVETRQDPNWSLQQLDPAQRHRVGRTLRPWLPGNPQS